MRVRKKKNGKIRIEACRELLIEDVERLKEDPQYAFDVKRPLHLEIGCGKGNFACGMAAANPDVNLIAMEKVPDVACLALEKAMRCKEERPDNLRFIIADVQNLFERLPDDCTECIYLNFSDPWPKSGHAKRRLTYHTFLENYRRLLIDGGLLRFKTDNVPLFDFSLEEFKNCGLEILWVTRDLHASEYNEGNVMTEYEANFTAKGMPICSALVRFHKKEKENA